LQGISVSYLPRRLAGWSEAEEQHGDLGSPYRVRERDDCATDLGSLDDRFLEFAERPFAGSDSREKFGLSHSSGPNRWP
jgi:hypothetical protein